MRKQRAENGVGTSGGGPPVVLVEAAQGQDRPLGPTVEAAVGEYVMKVRAAKREATWRNAQAHLRPWAARVTGRGARYMGQLTTRTLLDDLVWLRETPSLRTGRLRTDTTVKTTATAVRGFLSCSYDDGYIDRRLLSDFEIPKGRKASTRNPTSDNLTILFSIVDDFWDRELRPEIALWSDSLVRWYPTRMRAMLLVQITTALRIGETCHLNLQDWDKERGIITARVTKSGRPRDVPDCPTLKDALEAWLKVRPKDAPTPYLFTTETGGKVDPKTITQTLRRYLIWARERGVEVPRITLHSLRHYAISKVANLGGLSQAQELAGHTQPSTTKLYVHTTTEVVRDAVNKAGLLDGIVVNKRAAKRRGGKPRGKRLIK